MKHFLIAVVAALSFYAAWASMTPLGRSYFRYRVLPHLRRALAITLLISFLAVVFLNLNTIKLL